MEQKVERNTDSGFVKSETTLHYNQALLENMAFFTDAVWALEMDTLTIRVLHDRLNHSMVGKLISLEEGKGLIHFHVSTSDVEMILSSMTPEYFKAMKSSEEFITSNYGFDDELVVYRMVMSPDLDEDGNTKRVYISFAFTGRQ